jgi:hypothetical protein
MSVFELVQARLKEALYSSASDIAQRDEMIREVSYAMLALKFYADTKNYHGYESGVLVDNGKIARAALGEKKR